MVFDFLLKALRRVPRDNQSQQSPVPIEEEDEAIDPMNPFPDPVIIEFNDVIDLHSIPPRQVRAVVEDYLEEAHRRGFQWVRIIHGKGIGVQREMIRSILARSPFVIDYKDAPPEAGGRGATLVTLENIGSRQ
jgi:dsDNA-specific endonuclease/ATPase MutS2